MNTYAKKIINNKSISKKKDLIISHITYLYDYKNN